MKAYLAIAVVIAVLAVVPLVTASNAVLNFLEIEPGASNAELARRAFVTPQTMQAILVSLERAGLISRTPHPEHGRIQMTKLTAKGRKALEAASGIVADAEARLRDAAAPLDPREVAATLRRLASAGLM